MLHIDPLEALYQECRTLKGLKEIAFKKPSDICTLLEVGWADQHGTTHYIIRHLGDNTFTLRTSGIGEPLIGVTYEAIMSHIKTAADSTFTAPVVEESEYRFTRFDIFLTFISGLMIMYILTSLTQS